MPLAPEAEARELLRRAGYDVDKRPASVIPDAVQRQDVQHVRQFMQAVGIPVGSPLGQSLLRLVR